MISIEERLDRHRAGILALLSADWEKGFDLYRYRLVDRPPEIPLADELERTRYRSHLDTGAPIVICGEQGLGDQLFFLRYVPRDIVEQLHVYFCVDSKLVQLLSYNGYRCVDSPGEIPESCAVMMGDLPYLTECYEPIGPINLSGWDVYKRQLMDMVNAGGRIPRHWPNGRLPHHWPKLLTYRAGVEWQKEIPLETFANYLTKAHPGSTFANITRFQKYRELDYLADKLDGEITDLWEFQDDLLLLASLMELCPGYIGVSSTAAHLFGAVNTERPMEIFPNGGVSWYWKPCGNTWYGNASLLTADDISGKVQAFKW